MYRLKRDLYLHDYFRGLLLAYTHYFHWVLEDYASFHMERKRKHLLVVEKVIWNSRKHEFEKVFELKLNKFTLFTHSFVG